MSDVPFPVLVAAVFLLTSLTIVHLAMRHQNAQRALPERDAYLATHGLQAVACAHCQSTETRELGLDDAEDDRRLVACARCEKMLFRYTRDTLPHA
ncbi:hypothetical protein [Aromatoleum toluclasticum]|uniref:hypothetical protein n=1 Tax=Aromatoleum toluclasticum TaxID=92003 RepID=UPI0003719ED8|nr:hypothetical protein [Aromatoleum toluclasticum]